MVMYSGIPAECPAKTSGHVLLVHPFRLVHGLKVLACSQAGCCPAADSYVAAVVDQVLRSRGPCWQARVSGLVWVGRGVQVTTTFGRRGSESRRSPFENSSLLTPPRPGRGGGHWPCCGACNPASSVAWHGCDLYCLGSWKRGSSGNQGATPEGNSQLTGRFGFLENDRP